MQAVCFEVGWGGRARGQLQVCLPCKIPRAAATFFHVRAVGGGIRNGRFRGLALVVGGFGCCVGIFVVVEGGIRR
jgi:hypothetical protein